MLDPTSEPAVCLNNVEPANYYLLQHYGQNMLQTKLNNNYLLYIYSILNVLMVFIRGMKEVHQ